MSERRGGQSGGRLRLSEPERIHLLRFALFAPRRRAVEARVVLLKGTGWSPEKIAAELHLDQGDVVALIDGYRTRGVVAIGRSRGRTASPDARPEPPSGPIADVSSRAAVHAIVRLIRGERLDPVALDLGVEPATLACWRDAFFEGGRVGLEAADPSPGRS